MERGAVRGFRVFEHLAFEITDDYAIGIMAEPVVGGDGDLTASAGSIDNILRHGVARGVSSELFHDLEAASYTGSQMGAAINKVALIDIKRSNPAHQEFLH